MAKDLSDVTGLPDDLGIGDDLARTETELRIRVEHRRYGKAVTVVEGIPGDVDAGALASELKRALATGGTVDDGRIELQGDHESRLPDLLREKGYGVA